MKDGMRWQTVHVMKRDWKQQMRADVAQIAQSQDQSHQHASYLHDSSMMDVHWSHGGRHSLGAVSNSALSPQIPKNVLAQTQSSSDHIIHDQRATPLSSAPTVSTSLVSPEILMNSASDIFHISEEDLKGFTQFTALEDGTSCTEQGHDLFSRQGEKLTLNTKRSASPTDTESMNHVSIYCSLPQWKNSSKEGPSSLYGSTNSHFSKDRRTVGNRKSQLDLSPQERRRCLGDVTNNGFVTTRAMTGELHRWVYHKVLLSGENMP
jgi:hypothetical protein